MLSLRKIDYVGQLVFSMIILLSVPFFYLLGFLAGLFIIGCWQLLSAALNTYSFVHTTYKKNIWLYWKLCLADLLLLFISWGLVKFFDPDEIQIIFWIAIAGAAVIAVYYLSIYKKLIEHLSLRNELDGITRSKH